MDCCLKNTVSKEKAFQYSVATLFLSLADPDGSSRQQKSKATLCSQIKNCFPLSKSDIVPRNVRWIFSGMTLFRIVASRHIYCDCQEVEAKIVVKQAQQNEAINIEIFNDQFINVDTLLTLEEGDFSQRVHILFIYCLVKKADNSKMAIYIYIYIYIYMYMYIYIQIYMLVDFNCLK